jgi:hypothetical protein
MSRAKLDSTIRVHGVEFDLCFVQGAEDGDLHGINNGLVKWPDGRSPIVKIDAAAGEDAQREAAFHELFHIADIQTSQEARMSEDAVTRIARYLYGIGRDNPKLFAWIFQEQEE